MDRKMKIRRNIRTEEQRTQTWRGGRDRWTEKQAEANRRRQTETDTHPPLFHIYSFSSILRTLKGGGRGAERPRDTDRDRQSDAKRQKPRGEQRDTHRDRQADRDSIGRTGRQRNRQGQGETDIQTDRQTSPGPGPGPGPRAAPGPGTGTGPGTGRSTAGKQTTRESFFKPRPLPSHLTHSRQPLQKPGGGGGARVAARDTGGHRQRQAKRQRGKDQEADRETR